MSEYKILTQDIGSIMSRDVVQAAADMTEQVNQHLKDGWTPIGGLATVQAGTGIYLLQALGR
jgi:hypothetical protein